MTLGTPCAAHCSMRCSSTFKHSACCSGCAKPFAKPWLPAMAHLRPSSFSMGQCSGPISSTDFTPNFTESFASSGMVSGRKFQVTSDWLMRPFFAT